jgi:excisionase family DNA binding protein
VSSWVERIARRLTDDGSVIVPPRIAAWLEDKASVTSERRIMLRDVDPTAYEVLAALRLAALAHRSGNGTKIAAPQPDQPQSESWLTTSQAAQTAGVTDRCIRKWIAQHRLPATRHGERWLIRPDHLHLITTT